MKKEKQDRKFIIESPHAAAFPFLVLTILALGIGLFLFLHHLAHHQFTYETTRTWGQWTLLALALDLLFLLLFYRREQLWVRVQEGRCAFTQSHHRRTKWTAELISYQYFWSSPWAWPQDTPKEWTALEASIRATAQRLGQHRVCIAELLFEDGQRLLLYDCALPWQGIPAGWNYLSCGTYLRHHTSPPEAENFQYAHAFDLVALIGFLDQSTCAGEKLIPDSGPCLQSKFSPALPRAKARGAAYKRKSSKRATESCKSCKALLEV